MATGLSFSASRSFSGPLARTNSINTRQIQATAKPAPVVDLLALQTASQVLQEQLIKDAQIIPDLAETLTTRRCFLYLCVFIQIDWGLAGGQVSASYNVSPEDYLVPFSKRRHINIPEGLWQHYNSE